MSLVQVFINELYSKYLKVTDKERKLSAVKKALVRMGIPEEYIRTSWNPEDAVANAEVNVWQIDSDLEDKVREMFHNRFNTVYKGAVILATTAEKKPFDDREKVNDEVLGTVIVKRIENSDEAMNYIKVTDADVNGIKVYVYLVVYDYEEDC